MLIFLKKYERKNKTSDNSWIKIMCQRKKQKAEYD